MAESGLSLSLTELKAEIGEYLGLGEDSATWSVADAARVDAAIKRGLRQFYVPPALREDGQVHQWTFLRPISTLTIWSDAAVDEDVTVDGGDYANGSTPITASEASFYPSMIGRSIVITDVGTFTINGYTSSTVISVLGDASGASGATFSIASGGLFRLPDAFGYMDGRFVFHKDENRASPIAVTSAGFILQRRRSALGTGTPAFAAILPAASDGSGGQRWEAWFDRDPSEELVLQYRYYVHKDALSTNNPYPLGGAAHAETIIESCLSIAEQRQDDGGRGLHAAKFKERLAASIAFDQRLAVVENLDLGAGDGGRDPWGHRMGSNVVTYEGVEYN